MGDDSIDMEDDGINAGYLVTLPGCRRPLLTTGTHPWRSARRARQSSQSRNTRGTLRSPARGPRAVAAQVGLESKVSKRVIIL